MNPIPVIRATMRRHWLLFLLFSGIVAFAIALGAILGAQERGFRQASARAADKFDILVAAPGSQTDVVLTAIYLRPGTVPLLDAKVLGDALAAPHVAFAAPIAFGDNHQGAPIIGTLASFVDYLSGGLAEGSTFRTEAEAVVGAASPLKIGDRFKPEHGLEHHAAAAEDEDGDIHDLEITVVGRMKPTGTPWDRAIAVPVEQVWKTHSLPNGHPPGDERIGLPFDPRYISGVPVVVVKPDSVVAAYRLRAQFRGQDRMSFFPAEVLVQIYGLMGNVQALLSSIVMATQLLVLLALAGGAFAIVSLSRRQFAVLRVLGAPRGYVVLCVWSYVAIIIVMGTVLGLAMAAGLSSGLAAALSKTTGLAITALPGEAEIRSALSTALIGLALALVPAGLIAVQKPMDGLN
ncbi:MAG: ABC transporter permease [Beijerinckiaceae bacterium]|nr:ABC transporter permease [Beijerinckiaceae bacterium]